MPLKMVKRTRNALVLEHLTRLSRAYRTVALMLRHARIWKSRRKKLQHDFEFP